MAPFKPAIFGVRCRTLIWGSRHPGTIVKEKSAWLRYRGGDLPPQISHINVEQKCICGRKYYVHLPWIGTRMLTTLRHVRHKKVYPAGWFGKYLAKPRRVPADEWELVVLIEESCQRVIEKYLRAKYGDVKYLSGRRNDLPYEKNKIR